MMCARQRHVAFGVARTRHRPSLGTLSRCRQSTGETRETHPPPLSFTTEIRASRDNVRQGLRVKGIVDSHRGKGGEGLINGRRGQWLSSALACSAMYCQTRATPCKRVYAARIVFSFISFLYFFPISSICLLFLRLLAAERTDRRSMAVFRGRGGPLPSFSTRTIFNDSDILARKEGKGEKARRLGTRVSSRARGDTDSPRLGSGEGSDRAPGSPGRLRPSSAPIKGRCAVRASANPSALFRSSFLSLRLFLFPPSLSFLSRPQSA